MTEWWYDTPENYLSENKLIHPSIGRVQGVTVKRSKESVIITIIAFKIAQIIILPHFKRSKISILRNLKGTVSVNKKKNFRS